MIGIFWMIVNLHSYEKVWKIWNGSSCPTFHHKRVHYLGPSGNPESWTTKKSTLFSHIRYNSITVIAFGPCNCPHHHKFWHNLSAEGRPSKACQPISQYELWPTWSSDDRLILKYPFWSKFGSFNFTMLSHPLFSFVCRELYGQSIYGTTFLTLSQDIVTFGFVTFPCHALLVIRTNCCLCLWQCPAQKARGLASIKQMFEETIWFWANTGNTNQTYQDLFVMMNQTMLEE